MKEKRRGAKKMSLPDETSNNQVSPGKVDAVKTKGGGKTSWSKKGNGKGTINRESVVRGGKRTRCEQGER